MPKARILVADDSVVVRRTLTDVLNAEPTMEVVGIAANGKIALSRITQLNPDLVILDVEMPEMDGIETLRELRKTHPELPVIMFSALTERGADSTMRALSFGASDYVTKPTALAGANGTAVEQIRSQLVPKIRALLGPRGSTLARPSVSLVPAPSSVPASPRLRPRPFEKIDVLALGCSTGGPNALAELFAGLPPTFPVPILVTQHMPPVFTRALAERLSATSALLVHEAHAGQVVEPGHAYIAPGDFHMTAERRGAQVVLDLSQGPPENSCRPAVDVMFRSVSRVYGGRVLAVVLTGMGQDGLRGCETLWENGAQIVVQDEASSVVWGMPGFVAKAGLADAIVPLSVIAPEVLRRVGASRVPSRVPEAVHREH